MTFKVVFKSEDGKNQSTLFLNTEDVLMVAFDEGTITSKSEENPEESIESPVSFLRIVMKQEIEMMKPHKEKSGKVVQRLGKDNLSYTVTDRESIERIMNMYEELSN